MSPRVLGALAAAGAFLVSWAAVSQPLVSRAPAPPVPRAAPVPSRLGIAKAPAGSRGHYVLQHSRASALFTDRGVELRLPSRTREARALGWRVAGGRPVKPEGDKLREAKLHRLMGPRESWEREVPTYGGLRYPGVLPGVDLWFEERADGMEYGFRAERGQDLRRVLLEYAGASQLRVVEQGRALEVDLGEGVLREEGLRCSQEAADGSTRAVACRFTDARPVGHERWEYAIEVDVEDPRRPVVVDPLVLWNTYLGTAGEDELRDLAVNSVGEVFIAGSVSSASLSPPTDAGTKLGSLGSTDVLVAKFHEDGGLAWSSLLGGSMADSVRAIALGSAGEVYLAGVTFSPGIAVNMPDGGDTSSLRGMSDGFVAQLAPSGQRLDWVMYYGGTGDGGEEIHDMAVLPDGGLILVGETTSERLPGTAGTQIIKGTEAFMVPLYPQGTSTPQMGVGWLLMGSGSIDVARSVAISADGILVSGTSNSSDFPNSFNVTANPTYKGGLDAFVLRFNQRGGLVLSWRAFLGGSSDDEGRALVYDSANDRCVVAGIVNSPTLGPEDVTPVGAQVFVARLEQRSGSFGNALFLQGAPTSEGLALAIDQQQNVYVAGRAASTFVPHGGFDTTSQGTTEAFVTRLQFEPTPGGSWSSYVGGNGSDEVFALAVDERNRLFIGGSTTSTDLRYADAGHDLGHTGGNKEMFLLAVDSQGGGGVTDGGGGEADGGPGAPSDAGTETDGGQQQGGRPPVTSPLGWSCSASGRPGVLALLALLGLALRTSPRQRRASASQVR